MSFGKHPHRSRPLISSRSARDNFRIAIESFGFIKREGDIYGCPWARWTERRRPLVGGANFPNVPVGAADLGRESNVSRGFWVVIFHVDGFVRRNGRLFIRSDGLPTKSARGNSTRRAIVGPRALVGIRRGARERRSAGCDRVALAVRVSLSVAASGTGGRLGPLAPRAGVIFGLDSPYGGALAIFSGSPRPSRPSPNTSNEGLLSVATGSTSSTYGGPGF